MSGYKTPEQLDKEADELLRQEGYLPPEETPDSEAPQKDKPETEPDPKLDPPAEDIEIEGTPAKADGDDEPAPVSTASPETQVSDTDELEGLTLENAQERIRNAQSRMHRATQETAEFRKSNTELTARLQTMEVQVSNLTKELETAKATPPAPLPDSDDTSGKKFDSLEAIRSEYPSIIDPILEVVTSLQTSQAALKQQVIALGGSVNDVKGTVTKQSEDDARVKREAAQQKHFDKILAVHKDAFTIVDSDEFNGWLDRQVPMYRRIIEVDGSAADIIKVLTEYKQAVGTTRVNDAKQVATPATPKARTQPTKTKPTFTRAQIDAMPMDEFQRREGEIDAALADGRVTT